jgi:hypothetical protein
MKKTFYLILIAILSISCSNELDRGDAEDKIEDFFDYPNVELIRFPGVTSSQKLNKEFQSLRGQKFITEKRKGKYGNEFWVRMTEIGKGFVHSGEASYNGYQVASSILELNEVTGIRLDDGKNTAIVDYTLRRTDVTPFGNAMELYDGDIIEKQIAFQLYDDGWRITGKKPKTIIKEKDFAGFDSGFIEKAEKEMAEMEMAMEEVNLRFARKEQEQNESKNNSENYIIYSGKIKSYPITMKIKHKGIYDCDDGGFNIEGFYYYNKSGPNNKLNLTGYICGKNLNIEERDANNNITGIFKGIKNNNSVQGNWINPKTNKKLTFKIVEK